MHGNKLGKTFYNRINNDNINNYNNIDDEELSQQLSVIIRVGCQAL